MSLPKVVIIFTVFLFSAIGFAALLKKDKKSQPPLTATPIEIDLSQKVVKQAAPAIPPVNKFAGESGIRPLVKTEAADLPHANKIDLFFNKDEPKFPIVETITYRSRVAWQKGRPAWLSDYAVFYSTSRHFIARSLNGKPDYLKQDVMEGDRFNVLRKDKNINFHLVADVSSNRLWFYYLDLDTNQRVLVKDYVVGVGKEDSGMPSGLLTPLGTFKLGKKIAVYKPKMMGFYNGQKVEMLTVFGTRWIPFEKESNEAEDSSKGLGIHGVPWKVDDKGVWQEDMNALGKHISDGCISLSTADMEELFAIIITRPTTIEIVNDFKEASLPGVER